MKKLTFLATSILVLSLHSCKKDDAVTCITCISSDTLSFELCNENDGNASVNGENTGTPYDMYLFGLQASNVECGN